MGFQCHVHYSSNCSKTIVYILTLVMLNIFKCISEFYHVICQYSSYKYIIWKIRSLRNRENLQYKKTTDSVLLYLFMRTNGKCNNSHTPSTGFSGVFCFPSEPNIPEGSAQYRCICCEQIGKWCGS